MYQSVYLTVFLRCVFMHSFVIFARRLKICMIKNKDIIICKKSSIMANISFKGIYKYFHNKENQITGSYFISLKATIYMGYEIIVNIILTLDSRKKL